jgi:putative membrane protein
VVEPFRFVADWEWIAAIAIAAVDYALVVRVERGRGRPVPALRIAAFAAGLAVVAAALVSPIQRLALTSMLSFHLLQNVMLADWAPPLLVLGLTPAMAARAERAAPVRWLTMPAVALPLWLAVWYVLHLPAVYDYALRHAWALGLEHLAFLIAGLCFWWPVLVPGRIRPTARVAYLFAAFVVQGPVAVAIALASTPLYDFYVDTPKLWGLSPLEDQQYGAIGMAVEGSVLLFAAILVAFVRMLEAEERRDDAPPERAGPAGKVSA